MISLPNLREPFIPGNDKPIDPKTEDLLKKLDAMTKRAEQPSDGQILEPLKPREPYKSPGIPDPVNPGGRIEMDADPVVTDVTPDPDAVSGRDDEDLDPDTTPPVEGENPDSAEDWFEEVVEAAEDAVETVKNWWDSLFGN